MAPQAIRNIPPSPKGKIAPNKNLGKKRQEKINNTLEVTQIIQSIDHLTSPYYPLHFKDGGGGLRFRVRK